MKHYLMSLTVIMTMLTENQPRMNLENGPFPPRKDGGYGWFIIEETINEAENCTEYNAGCNVAGDDTENKNNNLSHIYYYWISKYYDNSIYHNTGTRWLYENGIPQNSDYGIVKRNLLSDEDAACLIQNNLIIKSDDDYKLNFACFTEKQFKEFTALFDINDERLDDLIAEWIITVRKNFVKFVPARLDSQINQWVSGYLFQIIGYVIDELIRRGTLRKLDSVKPLTDGVFYVEGKYIDP